MAEMKAKVPVYVRVGDAQETEIGTVEFDFGKENGRVLGDARSQIAAALRAAADKVEEG